MQIQFVLCKSVVGVHYVCTALPLRPHPACSYTTSVEKMREVYAIVVFRHDAMPSNEVSCDLCLCAGVWVRGGGGGGVWAATALQYRRVKVVLWCQLGRGAYVSICLLLVCTLKAHYCIVDTAPAAAATAAAVLDVVFVAAAAVQIRWLVWSRGRKSPMAMDVFPSSCSCWVPTQLRKNNTRTFVPTQC